VKMSEEKVEMSEVPLEKTGATTDTATAGDLAKGEERTPSFMKPKFTMPAFLKRDRSKSKEKTVDATEKEKENLINGDSPKPDATKPKRQWFKKKPAPEGTDAPAEPKPCDMTIGLNMNDRDEKCINENVKLQFDDIFGEPEGYHSVDCAWRSTYRTFNGVRCVCYKILAAIFAIPCAIVWGFIFALLACLNVWACVPTGKCMNISLGWIFKTWGYIIHSLFDPLFRAIGLCCGAIHVRRHVVMEPRIEIAQMA